MADSKFLVSWGDYEYGELIYNGRFYILKDQPELTGCLESWGYHDYYAAPAVGEDGREYWITWEMLPEWVQMQEEDPSNCCDESNACDWDNPASVELND